MKKLFVGIIAALLTVSLFGCGAEQDVSRSVSEESSKTESVNIPSENEDSSDSSGAESSKLEEKNLESIKVTYEDGGTVDGKTKMTVWVENTGEKIFTGDIHLYFYNGDHKKTGYDMIIVENLKPGQKTYCNIFTTPSESVEFKYDFSKLYKFEEDVTESGAELDDEKSKELSEMMEGSFGGAGNPEFATSWYKYIENLEIYSGDSGYYAVVTVSSDATYEATDRIAHSVLANFDNPNLIKTIVNDTSGNQIKEISK